jgi:hypothetical protein
LGLFSCGSNHFDYVLHLISLWFPSGSAPEPYPSMGDAGQPSRERATCTSEPLFGFRTPARLPGPAHGILAVTAGSGSNAPAPEQ